MQKKVRFELASFYHKKGEVPIVETEVQASTGRTLEADDGTELIGRLNDDSNEVETPEREKTGQVGGFSSSKGKDEMPALETSIYHIVK